MNEIISINFDNCIGAFVYEGAKFFYYNKVDDEIVEFKIRKIFKDKKKCKVELNCLKWNCNLYSNIDFHFLCFLLDCDFLIIDGKTYI